MKAGLMISEEVKLSKKLSTFVAFRYEDELYQEL